MISPVVPEVVVGFWSSYLAVSTGRFGGSSWSASGAAMVECRSAGASILDSISSGWQEAATREVKNIDIKLKFFKKVVDQFCKINLDPHSPG